MLKKPINLDYKLNMFYIRYLNAWIQFHEECEIEKRHKNQLKIKDELYTIGTNKRFLEFSNFIYFSSFSNISVSRYRGENQLSN